MDKTALLPLTQRRKSFIVFMRGRWNASKDRLKYRRQIGASLGYPDEQLRFLPQHNRGDAVQPPNWTTGPPYYFCGSREIQGVDQWQRAVGKRG